MTQDGRGFPLREVVVAGARSVQPAGRRLLTFGPDRGKQASSGFQRDLPPEPACRTGDSITTAIPVLHGSFTSDGFDSRLPCGVTPAERDRSANPIPA